MGGFEGDMEPIVVEAVLAKHGMGGGGKMTFAAQSARLVARQEAPTDQERSGFRWQH